MNLYQIRDVEFSDVLNKDYDLGIFTSGYEMRSSYVASRILETQIRSSVVLGFHENRKDEIRMSNDEYFYGRWPQEQVISSTDRDEPILNVLHERLTQSKDELNLLVDYSSMSKLWYAAILNWVRYSSRNADVKIDFVYSIGNHKDDISPLVINDSLSIPGCEGKNRPLAPLVSILGLGFDGYAALCVSEHLESDQQYNFIAAPAAFRDYPSRARKINHELISRSGKGHLLELPLASVQQTFGYLSELVVPFLGMTNITIVPMGPKPHVLASILLAMRFPDITCLRLSGDRRKFDRVGTTGAVVATSVHFKPEKQTDLNYI